MASLLARSLDDLGIDLPPLAGAPSFPDISGTHAANVRAGGRRHRRRSRGRTFRPLGHRRGATSIDVSPDTLRAAGFDEPPDGPVTIPHMIEFDSQERYVFASVAGAITIVIDARTKEVVEVLPNRGWVPTWPP